MEVGIHQEMFICRSATGYLRSVSKLGGEVGSSNLPAARGLIGDLKVYFYFFKRPESYNKDHCHLWKELF